MTGGAPGAGAGAVGAGVPGAAFSLLPLVFTFMTVTSW